MNDIAIRVENLGKRYRIGKRERYQTLRDTLTDTVTAPFRWLRKVRSANGNGAPDHIWALKDISFEIPRGEVVGIIGRNGAGKSTLLKVLSRITEPTEGHAEIRGRVGSLLEVGTGFHPELTGRENIYLNGAILGMRKAEITKKFDEIVAFAETEKFLDTPVKHYSSGMYTRLAFAVAAHLEPEILVVDEVLAVGDSALQKKCLGKMGDVAKQGRTVLFVSHNLGAVVSLCPRAVLMQQGRCIGDGKTEDILAKYLAHSEGDTGEVIDNSKPAENQRLKIRKFRIVDEHGNITPEGHLPQRLNVEMEFEILRPGNGYVVAIRLFESQHGCIFTSDSFDKDPDTLLRLAWTTGKYLATFPLPVEILRGGEYWIKAYAGIPMVEAIEEIDR